MADEPTRKPLTAARLLRRVVLLLAALVAAVALAEGGASLFLALRGAGALGHLHEQAHSRYDAELGWVHEPGARLPDLYGPGRHLTINAQGLRATREYTREIPAGQRRVLCLGDSFTLGFGVGDEHTFPARLEALCDGLETVNMGQGGYGLGQAWLWYERDGDQLRTDVVLLSFIDADLYRMQKEVFTGYPKPRLRVEGGELVAVNVPVPRVWGEHAGQREWNAFLDGLALRELARPAESGPSGARPPVEPDLSEADSLALFELAEHVLGDLRALVEARGAKLVLAYIPTKKLLYLKRETRIRKWVTRYARDAELPLIDLQPMFERLDPSAVLSLFLVDNHFDVQGNELVAHGLKAGLADVLPGFLPCEDG